jgi:hypothetical protein
MDFFAVASVAIAWEMGHRRDHPDLMLDGIMTIGAFDLVFRDVLLVKKGRGEFGAHNLRFIVTFHTLPFRDMAVPLDDAEMALFAGNSPGNVLPVIETPSFDLDVSFGLNVARGAPPDCTGDAVLFSLGPRLKVVTDKTVRFMNREMGSLNDLGMATGTPKLHPPPQVAQMFSVREGHILIDHLFLKVLGLMTPFLETA